jgi:hypothetical protein
LRLCRIRGAGFLSFGVCSGNTYQCGEQENEKGEWKFHGESSLTQEKMGGQTDSEILQLSPGIGGFNLAPPKKFNLCHRLACPSRRC